MLTFLFWNLKRGPRLENVARLVERHGVDVLMLAESTLGIGETLIRLNSGGRSAFHYNAGNCERVAVFSKLDGRRMRPIVEDEHVSIRRARPVSGDDILLAVAHLRSRLHQSDDSQTLAATSVANLIARAERKVGHTRTLLVGDLNMDPFDHGVVAAGCLHATMDRRIAAAGARSVGGKAYSFFYNPMWSMLGDASPGPPGTYYHRRSEHIAYFWHMFDQVLLRPALLPLFSNQDISILDTDGVGPFVKGRSGAPDVRVASDHLPILFRLTHPGVAHEQVQ